MNVFIYLLLSAEFAICVYIGMHFFDILKLIFIFLLKSVKIIYMISIYFYQKAKDLTFYSNRQYIIKFDFANPFAFSKSLFSGKLLKSLFLITTSLLLITTGRSVSFFSDSVTTVNNTFGTGDWTPPDTYITRADNIIDYSGRNVLLSNQTTIYYHAEDPYSGVDQVDLYYCYSNYLTGIPLCSNPLDWILIGSDPAPDGSPYDGSIIFNALNGDGYYLLQTIGIDKFSPPNTEVLDGTEFMIEVDTTPPIIDITSVNGIPAYNGILVSGQITFEGIVNDQHPHHYFFPAYYGNISYEGEGGAPTVANFNCAPGDVVQNTNSIINQSLLPSSCSTWDTTQVPDGYYTIFLGARDTGDSPNGNRAAPDWHNDERLVVKVDNTNPDTPNLIGWNAQHLSLTPGEDDNLSTPEIDPDLVCDPANAVWVNYQNLSQNWTDESNGLTYVKYYRRVRLAGNLSWTELASMVFNTPYMNGWYGFSSEGEFETQVRAFKDMNNNNQFDVGVDLSSNWSSSCNLGYDITAPQIPGNPGWGTNTPLAGYTGDGTGINNYVSCGGTITSSMQYYGVWGEVQEGGSDLFEYQRDVVYNGSFIGTYTSNQNYAGPFTPFDGINPNGGNGTYFVRVRAVDTAGNMNINDTAWANKIPDSSWCQLIINVP